MTHTRAKRRHPVTGDDVIGPDHGTQSRSVPRRSERTPSHWQRWHRLGLAGFLGLVAGTMLCATRAEGDTRGRRPG